MEKHGPTLSMTTTVYSPTRPAQHFSEEARNLLLPWGFSLLLPLPLILVEGEAVSSDIATLYVALSLGWFATEVFRAVGVARSRKPWSARILAFLCFACVNIFAFIAAGTFSKVPSNIPWPVLVSLAAFPALGLVPWLVLRMKQPQGAIVIGALIAGTIKIVACIIARIVYGPDFLEQGYLSADWNSAKLMISCVWVGIVAVSLITGFKAYRRCLCPSEVTNEPHLLEKG